MNSGLIYTREYPSPDIDRREILRYVHVRETDPDTEAMLDSCLNEAQDYLSYRVCYGIFPTKVALDEVNLSFCSVKSASLAKNMAGCDSAVVFCATIGASFDRLIAKYSRISPSRAVILQALGTERVEALCDEFNKDIARELGDMGYTSTTRFSPGYGDLPLSLQRDIFVTLEPQMRIGATLNNNLFMSPSKSVTAIIGFRK